MAAALSSVSKVLAYLGCTTPQQCLSSLAQHVVAGASKAGPLDVNTWRSNHRQSPASLKLMGYPGPTSAGHAHIHRALGILKQVSREASPQADGGACRRRGEKLEPQAAKDFLRAEVPARGWCREFRGGDFLFRVSAVKHVPSQVLRRSS